MATLPTSHLQLDAIAAALSETTTNVNLNTMCNSTDVHADGLNPAYCPGSTSLIRHANLKASPNHMNYFLGYNDSPSYNQIAVLKSATPCLNRTAVYVYSAATTLALAFAGGWNLYSDVFETMAPSFHYYTTGTLTPYYHWSSLSGWSTMGTCSALNTISCEYSTNSCDAIVVGDTVYTLNYTTISTAYSNNESIYGDSSGSAYATAGYYFNNGAIIPAYYWSGTAWGSISYCDPLHSISCEKSTTFCASLSAGLVYAQASSISNAYSGGHSIFTSAARAAYAPAYYYYDDGTTTPYHTWSGTAWTATGSCSTYPALNVGYTSAACGTQNSTTVYTSAASLAVAYSSSIPLYADSAGLLFADSHYLYDYFTTTPWYYWSQSGYFTGTGNCLTIFTLLSGAATPAAACAAGIELPRFHDGVGAWPANGDKVYTTSAGTTEITSSLYYSYATPIGSNSFYYTTSVTSTVACGGRTSVGLVVGSTAVAACASSFGGTYYHDGTGTYPANGDNVYTTEFGSTEATTQYYSYTTPSGSYSFYYTTSVTSTATCDSLQRLTEFISSPSATTAVLACNDLHVTAYYHDGVGTWPANGDKVYTTSAGTTEITSSLYYAANGSSFYYTTSVTNTTICAGSHTSYNASFESTAERACDGKAITFWHNGTGTYPVQNDEIYQDSGGTSAGTGYQAWTDGKKVVGYVNTGVMGSIYSC